jgi:hypothetical protein
LWIASSLRAVIQAAPANLSRSAKVNLPVVEAIGGAGFQAASRYMYEFGSRCRSPVVGPHFERLCRDYAVAAGAELFGGLPAEVGSGVVADPGRRGQIEVDVAVLAAAEPGRPRVVLSLGEVEWGKRLGGRHVERLRRARDLLAARGYDTSSTVLACYGGAGFEDGLTGGPDRVITVDPDRILLQPSG